MKAAILVMHQKVFAPSQSLQISMNSCKSQVRLPKMGCFRSSNQPDKGKNNEYIVLPLKFLDFFFQSNLMIATVSHAQH